MAINIADLMPPRVFKAKVDQWAKTIKDTKLQKGFDEITLPGERALREERERRANGVPIQPQYWAGMLKMAAEVGVDIDALRGT